MLCRDIISALFENSALGSRAETKELMQPFENFIQKSFPENPGVIENWIFPKSLKPALLNIHDLNRHFLKTGNLYYFKSIIEREKWLIRFYLLFKLLVPQLMQAERFALFYVETLQITALLYLLRLLLHGKAAGVRERCKGPQ